MSIPARLLSQLGSIAASGGGDTSSFESIATYSITSAQSTIQFTNIPQGFKHLQLRCIARASSSSSFLNIKINGDTTVTNYTRHLLYGDGSGGVGNATHANMPDGARTNIGAIPGTQHAAGVFGAFIYDITDFSQSTKYKTSKSIGGYDSNGGGEVDFNSAGWLNTSPITGLTITTYDGANLVQYSHFALYGLKG